MQFSHSSLDEFRTCPRKFYINRVKRLKPILKRSPLFFGSAIDDMFGRILVDHKKELTEEENELKSKTPMEIYLEYSNVWAKDEKCRFSVADLDLSLFSPEDLEDCFKFGEKQNLELSEDNYKAFLDACKMQLKKDAFALDNETQLGYNYFAVKSLELKTRLFLPILTGWVEDNILEVHSLQRKIEIVDGEDNIIGYIDFEATTKDGVRRIWDLKTSSKAYAENSANESPQLTIYSEAESTPDVGFLIIQKTIRKREPRVRIQEVTGIITEEQSEMVFSEVTGIVDVIKEAGKSEDNYPKNTDSCWKFGKCEFYDFCKNKNMEGLEEKEKR